MLLHYSLILKLIQLFFPLINLHTILHDNKKLKCLIYIRIQTFYSVLFWFTFGSDYRLKSSWVWRYKLGTPVFRGVSPIILWRSSQALSGWMGNVAAQLFSGLSRDVRSGSSPGSGCATIRDLSRSHSCIVLAVCLVFVLLVGESWPQSDVLSAL